MHNIYQEIAQRTGGNIYIGVVGPVRTGKSTLVKRFIENLALPYIQDPYIAERTRDELPQSGSGKTITTSEPKFIPEDPIELTTADAVNVRLRLIDSVGYMVPGAVGAEEDGAPRMVTTPWFDHEIPMEQAAHLGTQKVMQEHCTVGIVVTCDGSVTDIPREDYTDAERHAILDMQATGKPFLVIVNSARPGGKEAANVKAHIQETYAIEPIIADCQSLDDADIQNLLKHLLYAFPMRRMLVHFPRWLDTLDNDHPAKAALYQTLLDAAKRIHSVGQSHTAATQMLNNDMIEEATVTAIDLGGGDVSYRLRFPEDLYYEILSGKTGLTIENDTDLMNILCHLSEVKKQYDKISDAMESVKATGYGIVMPTAEEMQLQPPEVIRKGSTFGIRLKAGAPSIHMMKVDIDTQINPMVGGEQQSQELIGYLTSEDTDKIWQSNIFGKTVYELIQEGLAAKLTKLPEEVRAKFRGSLTRVVNEGANGLICLIL